jgi:hypothetical protein
LIPPNVGPDEYGWSFIHGAAVVLFAYIGFDAVSAAALPPGRSRVEIELEPKDGGTLLRLRHRGLPTTARAPFTPDEHGKRWAHYLAQLAKQCAPPAPHERKVS